MGLIGMCICIGTYKLVAVCRGADKLVAVCMGHIGMYRCIGTYKLVAVCRGLIGTEAYGAHRYVHMYRYTNW